MTELTRPDFWLRTKALTVLLLFVWLGVSLLTPWFARDLMDVMLFGFPLGFWLAAEGALLIFLALTVTYALVMDRLESRLEAHRAAAATESGTDARG